MQSFSKCSKVTVFDYNTSCYINCIDELANKMDPKDDGLIEVLSFLVKVLFDYPTSKLVVPNLYTLAQTSTTT